MDLITVLKAFLALVFVIALIAALTWAARKYGPGGRRVPRPGRGRLQVLEIAPLDARRRMMLIRRDNIEHLIMLSPTRETVIETGIEGNKGAGIGAVTTKGDNIASLPAVGGAEKSA